MAGLKELFDELKHTIVQISRALAASLKPYKKPLIAFAIVGFIIFAALPWYLQAKTQHITLLTGPEGADSQTQARQIQKIVSADSSSWLPDYQLHLERTEGLQQIRQFISEDSTGSFIGFAHDGFGSSENVRILLPLDDDYLHIICSKKFLEASNIPLQSHPRTFDSIAKLLKPGRVFVGPTNSGTRQIAKLVLDLYGLDCDKLHANGIADFNEMRSALNNNSIDLAFYCGPVPSRIVEKIAADNGTCLLGINGHRGAIAKSSAHVSPDEFNPQAYLYGDFCPEKLETITARRVLICSSHMSSNGAYHMTSYASKALRPLVGNMKWKYWQTGMPENENAKFTYDLHPGGKQFLLGTSTVFANWISSAFFLSFALWIAVEGLRTLRTKLPKSKTPVGETTSLSRSMSTATDTPEAPAESNETTVESVTENYDSLNGQIDAFHESLRGKTDEELEAGRLEFRKEVGRFRRIVLASLHRKKLSRHQCLTLSLHLDEIEVELVQFEPAEAL